jgi:hypothetical protein
MISPYVDYRQDSDEGQYQAAALTQIQHVCEWLEMKIGLREILAFSPSLWLLSSNRENGANDHFQAGQWLIQNLNPKDLVDSRWPGFILIQQARANTIATEKAMAKPLVVWATTTDGWRPLTQVCLAKKNRVYWLLAYTIVVSNPSSGIATTENPRLSSWVRISAVESSSRVWTSITICLIMDQWSSLMPAKTARSLHSTSSFKRSIEKIRLSST